MWYNPSKALMEALKIQKKSIQSVYIRCFKWNQDEDLSLDWDKKLLNIGSVAYHKVTAVLPT